MARHVKAQSGFTLLEILLAIALFAVLSLLTSQLLTATVNSNEATKQHQQRFAALVRAVNLLDKDVWQSVPLTALEGEKSRLMLTTASNNDMPDICCAPDLQRVEWSFKNHTLYRAIWRYPEDEQPSITQPVLTEVNAFTLRYYLKDAVVTTLAPDQYPRAIEAGIDINGSGTITRLLLLPEKRSNGGTP